jgi:ABC-type polysaccharide/polyol phosphate transport system ATPase subunit
MPVFVAALFTGSNGSSQPMTSIRARAVSVLYPVYGARSRSLRDHLIRRVGGGIAMREDARVVVTALENVTLSLCSGDRVALIGSNGAGKSTLLRVLAGILEPSTGEIHICGHVSSLLDMSMGMDPEATGYENIIMRSVFLGATFAEARARVQEIEAFSELGEYLRLPMRTYSTGMSLRLSFAIALAVQPKILVLDELMGVGDAAFAAKAHARLQEVVSKLEILVIATHDLNTARSMCNRGLVLEHGRVVVDASVEDAVKAYQGHSNVPKTASPSKVAL